MLSNSNLDKSKELTGYQAEIVKSIYVIIIKLEFLDFDLHTSEGCMEHYIQVFDGIRLDSPALTERMCEYEVNISSHIKVPC